MESIKACPFCGYPSCRPEPFAVAADPVHYGVCCEACGATGPFSRSENGCIEKWNMRKEKMRNGRIPNCT